MDWKKIKNVLILLLILANVIVGVMLLNLLMEKLYIPESEIDDVILNLSERGIKVSRDAVENEKQRNVIYSVNPVSRQDFVSRLSELSSLFGNFDEEPVTIDVPNGISLSKAGKAENISMEEVSGESISSEVFSATLTGNMTVEIYITSQKNDDGEVKLEDDILNSEKSEFVEIMRKYRAAEIDFCADIASKDEPSAGELKFIKKFYATLYDDDDYSRGKAVMGFRCYYSEKVFEGKAVSCVATADGIVIPEICAVFWFDENEKPTFVRGNFLAGSAKKSYSSELLEGIDIIYKMELDRISEIISQHEVFSLLRIDNESYYFIPSFSVIYRDKDGKNANNIYDGIVGELKSSVESVSTSDALTVDGLTE